ncbi:MAG: hypothetical protein ACUVV5_01975 [Candidatus Aminicenantales bacterium]
MLLGLSGASWLDLTRLELNLTSLRIMFYYSPRWGEAKSVLERSFTRRTKKRNAYVSYPAQNETGDLQAPSYIMLRSWMLARQFGWRETLDIKRGMMIWLAI